jgi:peroxiredoxin Q/BCP
LPKIRAGDTAPDFELKSQDNQSIRLSDYAGKKNVVLYFYPKDFTSGCTAEARGFRDSYREFLDSETEVIGVSADSVETHQRFSQQCELPFKLLSDSGKDLRELYGVSSTFGISGRVTFVIDKGGIVRHVFSSQLQPTKHIREALDALKAAKAAPRPT